MQNQSGGDSVALGIASLFPTSWDLGPRQYLSGDNSAIKGQFNQQTPVSSCHLCAFGQCSLL